MACLVHRNLVLTLLIFTLLSLGGVQSAEAHPNLFLDFNEENTDPYSDFNEAEVDARLDSLVNNAVPVRKDDVVKAFIKAYLYRHREKSQEILGRTLMYFPLFEELLAEHNIPEDIKYLAIVESALAPKAVSRVGAVGLWQFMPGTARENGLQIDYYVDERQDPVKSTLAAIKYLTQLYTRYDDWALALAAYNSGPGRVNRAIRRGRSRDFWRIRRYLPRETRNYVPAFLAVTYLVKHHDDHQIEPVYPSLDEQLTETITVRDEYTFQEIARVTGLSQELIQALNPTYHLAFIPADSRGHHLTLPRRVMLAFQDYAEIRNADKNRYIPLISTPVYHQEASRPASEYYTVEQYTVRPGEQLVDIAGNLQCPVRQLKAWNGLRSDQVKPNQVLRYYVPTAVRRFQLRQPMQSFAVLPKVGLPQKLDGQQEFARPSFPIYYDIKSKKRTDKLMKELPGIDPEKIRELNNLGFGETLRAGTRIILGRI
jgi:membrane-bound lytic murein transglycosylase D